MGMLIRDLSPPQTEVVFKTVTLIDGVEITEFESLRMTNS